MNARIVIYDGLLRQLPDLFMLSEDLGSELVSVENGKEVIPKIQAIRPFAVILDAIMPQMSGIELCKQIKQSEWGASTKVILISDQVSDTMRDRALDLGCDLFANRTDVLGTVKEFLKSHVRKAPQEPISDSNFEQRLAPRIDLTGKVSYFFEDKEFSGELINASRSGVLFAAEQEIPSLTHLVVRLYGSPENEYDLTTSVVRCVKLKSPKEGKAFGIGVKFLNITAENEMLLDALISYLAGVPSSVIEAPMLNWVLDISADQLSAVMADETSAETFKPFIGELSATEGQMLPEQGKVPDLVRRFAVLRAKCEAFTQFIPRLENEKKMIGPVFFTKLESLLAQVTAAEGEVDQAVREVVASGHEELRRSLNEASNRVHDAKLRLIFNTGQGIGTDGLSPGDQTILKKIKTEMESVQSLKQASTGPTSVKYDRKPLEPEPAKKEEKKDKKKGGNKTAMIVTLAIALPLTLASLWWQFGPPLTKLDLKLEVEYSHGRLSENELTLEIKRTVWNKLGEEKQQQVLGQLVEYLTQKRLSQAMILDENDRRVAAISSAQSGRKKIYLPRIFKK